VASIYASLYARLCEVHPLHLIHALAGLAALLLAMATVRAVGERVIDSIEGRIGWRIGWPPRLVTASVWASAGGDSQHARVAGGFQSRGSHLEEQRRLLSTAAEWLSRIGRGGYQALRNEAAPLALLEGRKIGGTQRRAMGRRAEEINKEEEIAVVEIAEDIREEEIAVVEIAEEEIAVVEIAEEPLPTDLTFGRPKLRPKVAKAEVAKAEVAKAEVAKAEVAKAAVDKAEVAKAEVAKAEVARAEVVKAEVARAEVAKTEVARAEVLKVEVARAAQEELKVAAEVMAAVLKAKAAAEAEAATEAAAGVAVVAAAVMKAAAEAKAAAAAGQEVSTDGGPAIRSTALSLPLSTTIHHVHHIPRTLPQMPALSAAAASMSARGRTNWIEAMGSMSSRLLGSSRPGSHRSAGLGSYRTIDLEEMSPLNTPGGSLLSRRGLVKCLSARWYEMQLSHRSYPSSSHRSYPASHRGTPRGTPRDTPQEMRSARSPGVEAFVSVREHWMQLEQNEQSQRNPDNSEHSSTINSWQMPNSQQGRLADISEGRESTFDSSPVVRYGSRSDGYMNLAPRLSSQYTHIHQSC